MTDLLTQIQNATGGSRELDVEIGEACGYMRASQIGPYRRYRALHPNGRTIDLPHFSTNIQDVVSLVPRDATAWSLNVEDGQCQALIFRDGDGVIGRGDAPTPALALCEAIIKAHQSKEERAA